jgi:hypothetical protein
MDVAISKMCSVRIDPGSRALPANLCPGLAGAEVLCDGDDFCESVGESVEALAGGASGRVRRNISSTWCAPDSASLTPASPTRIGATEGLGWGVRCLGFERASWNSRLRSVNVTSR